VSARRTTGLAARVDRVQLQHDRIHREITLHGNLTGEQRDALLLIADKCPVHRTLTREIAIQTHLTALPMVAEHL